MAKQGAIKMEITDKQLRKSLKSMKFWSDKTLEQVDQQIRIATLNTAADAVQNVKDNGSIATSRLINSISSRFKSLKRGAEGIVKVNAAYGGYVEFGRKAGGFPPIAPILTWIKKKGLATTFKINKKGRKVTDRRDASQEAEEKSMAFAIAKSIAKNGTHAQPFLMPSFRKNSDSLVKRIKVVLRNSGKNTRL